MINANTTPQLFDAKVIDRDGDKIGTVKQVYVGNDQGEAHFVTVNTGLFGTSETFIPVSDATFDATDGVLTVGYDKATVKDAPRIDVDGQLSPEEEQRLYSHYGLTPGGGSGYDATNDRDAANNHDATRGHDRTTDTARGAGHDTSGPNTDEAMTRSEEQLHVGTETTEAGRARLRKYVVTEQQTVNVPVSHEEVRIVREPITDANAGAALDGPALSEEEHEVTLHQDRVVVDKDAVPVERVRLGTETVTDTQSVTEDVSHEEIEVDGDGTTRTPGTDHR